MSRKVQGDFGPELGVDGVCGHYLVVGCQVCYLTASQVQEQMEHTAAAATSGLVSVPALSRRGKQGEGKGLELHCAASNNDLGTESDVRAYAFLKA